MLLKMRSEMEWTRWSKINWSLYLHQSPRDNPFCTSRCLDTPCIFRVINNYVIVNWLLWQDKNNYHSKIIKELSLPLGICVLFLHSPFPSYLPSPITIYTYSYTSMRTSPVRFQNSHLAPWSRSFVAAAAAYAEQKCQSHRLSFWHLTPTTLDHAVTEGRNGYRKRHCWGNVRFNKVNKTWTTIIFFR